MTAPYCIETTSHGKTLTNWSTRSGSKDRAEFFPPLHREGILNNECLSMAEDGFLCCSGGLRVKGFQLRV